MRSVEARSGVILTAALVLAGVACSQVPPPGPPPPSVEPVAAQAPPRPPRPAAPPEPAPPAPAPPEIEPRPVYVEPAEPPAAPETAVVDRAPRSEPPAAAEIQSEEPPREPFEASRIRALAAFSSSTILAGTGEGLYRSKDGGETWTRVVGPLERSAISVLLATRMKVGFAGTEQDGIFLTRDDGQTWSPAAGSPRSVAALIDGTARHGRYALVAASSELVFRSTDEGTSWTASAALPGSRVTSVALAGGLLYAGTSSGKLFQSTDLGAHWSEEKSVPWNGGVRVLCTWGLSIFAGTRVGLFETSDRGGSRWSSASNGLPGLDVTGFVGDDARRRLYTVVPQGLCLSEDRGETWTPVSDAVPTALAVAPDSTVFAGVDGLVWRSADAGKTWKKSGLRPASPPGRSSGSSAPSIE